jgi:AFG3 family protein
MIVLGFVVLLFVLYWLSREEAIESTLKQFELDVMSGNVSKIDIINDNRVRVYLARIPSAPSYYFNIGSLGAFETALDNLQNELNISAENRIVVKYRSEVNMFKSFLEWGPFLMFMGLVGYSIYSTVRGARGGGKGIFSIGKSNARLWQKGGKVAVSFKDVAGCNEAKVEIQEFVNFLKDPKKYEVLGARIPKGALLVGPPGTGKTLLAKATAGEAGVPFYSVSGSDFIEMFVGVGPSRVRDLFTTARQNAPCIIFIDEIDAIGRARGRGGFQGGNDERENTLNALLVEMDGFNTSKGIVVLAGTNRSDVLDKALLRPGRFDRMIHIENPDIKAREEIFLVHLRPLKLAKPPSEYATRLAALTPGFSGADIANVCNEAALIAARNDKTEIKMKDFDQAIDRVIGGLEKKSKVMSPEEKTIVAYHESGHAIVGWFLEHTDPVLKVSIVPRGTAALGFSQQLPEEHYLFTREQLLDTMSATLGGRAAEEIKFDSITTGASDDLQKITKMAYSQIQSFGMSDKVGYLNFSKRQQEEGYIGKPFSEATADLMDQEVRSMISEAYERAKSVLREHKDKLEQLATTLLEKEVVTHDEIKAILGPRPYARPEHEQWLKSSTDA